jgi:ABC-type dipeptide/oligopeptide/nickel transport system permease subunit
VDKLLAVPGVVESPVLVTNTKGVFAATLAEYALGAMLYFARASGAFLTDGWRWWVLPAGLMITLTVLSLALIGYTAEEVMEPGLRR